MNENTTSTNKENPTISAQIVAAKRKSISLDLIEQLEKQFPIKKNIVTIDDDGKKIEFLPFVIVDNLIKTQQKLLATLLYLSVDMETKKYFISDLKLGTVYPEEK